MKINAFLDRNEKEGGWSTKRKEFAAGCGRFSR
jgi:hypothetical protein